MWELVLLMAAGHISILQLATIRTFRKSHGFLAHGLLSITLCVGSTQRPSSVISATCKVGWHLSPEAHVFTLIIAAVFQ